MTTTQTTSPARTPQRRVRVRIVAGLAAGTLALLVLLVTGEVSPMSVSEPPRPAAMANEDAAGAIAATKYYRDLERYMFATGSSEAYEELSHSECTDCRTELRVMTELRAELRRLVLGRTTWVGEPEVVRVAEADAWLVRGAARFGGWELRDHEGKVVQRQASAQKDDWLLLVHDGVWQVRAQGETKEELLEVPAEECHDGVPRLTSTTVPCID